MANSFSSPNVDGPMRVDANHAGGKQYLPNSFAHKFRPDVAEAPYQVSDAIVSRKSHYYHEGKLSEYDQPRELYQRVMDDKARAALHSNTAKMLSHVNYAIISKRYLAQIYCISPEYARGVYDLTNFKHV
jgi:catalase